MKELFPQENLTLLELLTPIRTSDFHLEVLALCRNQNFWSSIRTFDVRLEVLALREDHKNFWPPVRTSDFRSLNQGESKLDPNSSKLVENLEIASWDGFLLG
jgi:hypothetical protein